MTDYQPTIDFAGQCDKQDPLSHFRDKFHIPQKDGKPVIYLCGNSLGLQPKSTKGLFESELNAWQTYGVEGHFEGERPWMYYHKNFTRSLANLVGAKENEVVAMNSVTANLHLMMVSFYRPTSTRYKILCEADAFPSDQYALETQVRHHGLDPKEAIVELKPPSGSHVIRTKDIELAISELGNELALVMIGGLQYYTGQLFDLKSITEAAHNVGAIAAFDLAHAVGNVPLELHDWGIDFAVWCSYKYLNSGPGGVGGAYVHKRHHESELQQFGGWWGHIEEERFLMKKGFDPIKSVDRWQLSNAPVFNMIGLLASLAIFQEAGMDRLRAKSEKLTGYLEYLIKNKIGDKIEIITPSLNTERGCQLSLFVNAGGKNLHKRLMARGVIGDWREPNVIRVAPVPLYNTFTDAYQFVEILKEELNK